MTLVVHVVQPTKSAGFILELYLTLTLKIILLLIKILSSVG